MAKKNKPKATTVSTGPFVLLCLLLGLVGGAFFVPLAEELHASFMLLPALREDIAGALMAVEPQLSQLLVGLGVFGLGSALIVRLALNGYARLQLKALTKRLRDQDLLPYHIEANKKRRGLRGVQEGMDELFDSYVIQLKLAHVEREKYRSALDKYADPTVGQRLRYSTDEDHHIKSERRAVAVIFSDIRGFTAMSEVLQPEQVVMILNEYFAFATDAVNKNGGKVNKFIGDAVMAIFDAPAAYKENAHAAKNAITAALAMQEAFQRALPKWQEKIPQVFSCNLGVGVHYGEAILGNLGSAERVEYTAIGDTVNFASRLCSLAKPGQVVVSEDTFEIVQDGFSGTAQDPVAVKGKTGLHATYVVKRKGFTL